MTATPRISLSASVPHFTVLPSARRTRPRALRHKSRARGEPVLPALLQRARRPGELQLPSGHGRVPRCDPWDILVPRAGHRLRRVIGDGAPRRAECFWKCAPPRVSVRLGGWALVPGPLAYCARRGYELASVGGSAVISDGSRCVLNFSSVLALGGAGVRAARFSRFFILQASGTPIRRLGEECAGLKGIPWPSLGDAGASSIREDPTSSLRIGPGFSVRNFCGACSLRLLRHHYTSRAL